MSLTVFICGCIAFMAAVLVPHLRVYKLSTYQGWRAIWRKVTPHENANITLHLGETLVAVVATKKGTYFFLSTQTRKRSYSG